MKQEVLEIKDYLVENNFSQGVINLFEDYFVNKAITKEEMDDILKQDNARDIINSYQLRGAQAWQQMNLVF